MATGRSDVVLSVFRVTGFGCTRHSLALPTVEVGDGARLQEQSALTPVQPGAGCLTSLCFSVCICKTGEEESSSQTVMRLKYIMFVVRGLIQS